MGAGIDPDYFLHRMQYWEVVRVCNGRYRKDAILLSQIRWIGWVIARVAGNKQIDTPQEMQPFYWEQEHLTPEEEAEQAAELEQLLQRSREYNQQQRTRKDEEHVTTL